MNLPAARDIRGLWLMTPLSDAEDRALLASSAFALIAAAALAAWRAARGDMRALHAVLWIAALTALASAQFFLPSDIHFRNARLAFIPLAACWGALALAAAESGRKTAWALAGCVVVLAAVAASLAHPLSVRALERENSDQRPAIRSGFDVYLDQDAARLIYRRDECTDADAAPDFFLEIHPANKDDLPERMRGRGFDDLGFGGSFHFGRRSGWERADARGGRCLFGRDLPDYPIAYLRTGQFADGAALWWAEIAGDMSVPEGAPDARGGVFNIYLDGNRLIYASQDCADDDIRGRFFLSIFPVRADDLSDYAKSQGLGHDALNFNFANRGAAWGGECAAVVPLPGYEIRAIETGQFIPDGGELWRAVVQGDVRVPDGEPAARGGAFAIYLDENRLIYFAQDCADEDIRGRFFLSVFPANADDLSRESRDRGLAHDALNFNFERRGVVADGSCVTVRALPDYEISAVETGQFVPGEGELWKVRIGVGGE